MLVLSEILRLLLWGVYIRGNKRKIELTREIRKEIYTFLNAPIDD